MAGVQSPAALPPGACGARQSMDGALAAFSSLFCVRCLMYGCLVHGGVHGGCLPHRQHPWESQ